MDFQNFYISTSKALKKSDLNILIFLILFVASLLVNIAVNWFNLARPKTDNTIVLDYQLSKIDAVAFGAHNTLIMGDSSAGNAIDHELFSSLTGTEAINLALTGAWGVEATLNLAKMANSKSENITSIVFIFTPTTWAIDLKPESVLPFNNFESTFRWASLEEVLVHYLSPTWTTRVLPEALREKKRFEWKITDEHDYLEQLPQRYHDGSLPLSANANFDYLTFSESKKEELKRLNSFCEKLTIRCYLLNGPLHRAVANRSRLFLPSVTEYIASNTTALEYIQAQNLFPNGYMGDSLSHIDPSAKHNVTKHYANLFNKLKF